MTKFFDEMYRDEAESVRPHYGEFEAWLPSRPVHDNSNEVPRLKSRRNGFPRALR